VVADNSSGGADNELTIERGDAETELGFGNFVYRTDEGRVLTRDEAFDQLTPAMAEGLEGQPAEDQVIDSADAEEFIFESGIFELLEAKALFVTQYTDGRKRWTNDQLREQVFQISGLGDLSFEDWLAAQVAAGTLTAVDVLQFIGYENEEADEETVITERLIVD